MLNSSKASVTRRQFLAGGGALAMTTLAPTRTLASAQKGNEGRDHHPFAFSLWLAGGGIKGGQVVGKTDEFGLNIVEDKIHIHDFHATILHCLGLLHEKLTYRHQGRDFRLTDVEGKVVTKLLA